jgi:hypothetical protein
LTSALDIGEWSASRPYLFTPRETWWTSQRVWTLWRREKSIVLVWVNLYSSPSIIRIIKSRRMRRAGHVARKGEKRNAYRILVGNPQGKRPLGRPRSRWVDYITMDLREVWTGLIWLRIGTGGRLL